MYFVQYLYKFLFNFSREARLNLQRMNYDTAPRQNLSDLVIDVLDQLLELTNLVTQSR